MRASTGWETPILVADFGLRQAGVLSGLQEHCKGCKFIVQRIIGVTKRRAIFPLPGGVGPGIESHGLEFIHLYVLQSLAHGLQFLGGCLLCFLDEG